VSVAVFDPAGAARAKTRVACRHVAIATAGSMTAELQRQSKIAAASRIARTVRGGSGFVTFADRRSW